ncbi:2-dehydropantoate 2-reductase, partial [Frankliniella fusca]
SLSLSLSARSRALTHTQTHARTLARHRNAYSTIPLNKNNRFGGSERGASAAEQGAVELGPNLGFRSWGCVCHGEQTARRGFLSLPPRSDSTSSSCGRPARAQVPSQHGAYEWPAFLSAWESSTPLRPATPRYASAPSLWQGTTQQQESSGARGRWQDAALGPCRGPDSRAAGAAAARLSLRTGGYHPAPEQGTAGYRRVVPLPLALPAPQQGQQGPQGAQQGQQDGLGTLEYAPQWGWYTPIANTASEVASLPGRPLQSNAPVSAQQYTGGSQTAQPIPSSGPQYTGQQYTGGSRPGPLEQVPGGGQQYSGQPYVGQQYTGQQYTGGSRPVLPELLPAGSAASPYPVDSRPVQQQRYPGLQYPPPYSTVDQPTVTVGYRGSSWTSSTASPGQLAAAEPQQDSGRAVLHQLFVSAPPPPPPSNGSRAEAHHTSVSEWLSPLTVIQRERVAGRGGAGWGGAGWGGAGRGGMGGASASPSRSGPQLRWDAEHVDL